ncbi:transposase [Niallia circulans]|nr:transposase [Niallia circulans]
MSDEGLFFFYKGGGRSAYHLKMMFKVLLFSYSQKVFSCRDIENATK